MLVRMGESNNHTYILSYIYHIILVISHHIHSDDMFCLSFRLGQCVDANTQVGMHAVW